MKGSAPEGTTMSLPIELNPKVKLWAELETIEPQALNQIYEVGKLPWIHGLRIMPDVHFGKGATEDGGVDRVTMGLCHHVVMIPTAHCLNLGNAVSTVLYDRLLKEQAKDPSRVLPTASYLNEVREIGVGDLYDRKGVWMGNNAEHLTR